MRQIIFILMIALLPLRGWMGEAMATTMAANELAINFIAIKADNTLAKIEFSAGKNISNCDVHKASSRVDSSEKSSCTACQACNATGSLTSAVKQNSIPIVRYAQPVAQISQFASANIAQSQKPPIL